MEDLKKHVLEQVYDNFVNSKDFNGYSLLGQDFDCTNGKLIQCLTELIKEGSIEIIGTSNPHIKRFDAESIEKQVELITTHSIQGYCIYPTQHFLENHRDTSCFDDRPFSKMLALGKAQLKCCYFNIDILRQYATDPRYDYSFKDYLGEIHSSNSVDESEVINLRSFGIGRNGDDYIIAVFLRDLNSLPAVAQQKWYPRMIADTTNCKVLKDYIDNQLFGSWYFPRTVFRAIIEEIENLYVLTQHIWGTPIFSNYYNQDDERLRNFEMLVLPTNQNLDEFYRQLEVLTVGNLNLKFFELKEFGLERFTYTKEDDCTIKKSKGTMQLLKEWLQKVKPDCVEEIHGILNKVRATRSKGGAHNLLKLQYSKDYYTEQFDISDEVFNALYVLRRIIQSHPNAEGVAIPHDSDKYIKI
jgi:hypothetical protein